jgi:hypothetical protein
MSDRQRHWTIATIGAGLGAYCSSLARIGAHVLDDVQLHQTAAIAVMGFAVGAWLLALRAGEREPSRASRSLAWASTSAAIALPLSASAWLRIARVLPATDVATCSAALLLALPLCIGGYATVSAVHARRRDFGLWLISVGLGASLCTLAIAASSPELVLAQSCLFIGLAALRTARPPVTNRFDALWSLSGLAFMLGLVVALWAKDLMRIPPQPPPLGEWQALRGRTAARGLRLAPQTNAWDGFGQVESFDIVDHAQHTTGLGVLLLDSGAFAPFLRLPHTLCTDTLLGAPYTAPRARVLLAGIGGSMELQCALSSSRESLVDVAEPSLALREVLRAPLERWLATLGAGARVRYHTASARSFVRSGGARRYDLIVLPAAAGKHHLPSGVLPLPEALLATDRGLADLLGALQPNGMLVAIVHGEPKALRFAATALAALRDVGQQSPQDLIAVEQSGDAYAIMLRRSAFGLEELLAMHAGAERRSTQPHDRDPLLSELLYGATDSPALRYMPGAGSKNRFGELFARAASPAAFQLNYVFDIGAPSDDRPLFNELTLPDRSDAWLSSSPYHALPLLALLAAVVALVLGSVACLRRGPPNRPGIRAAVALACCGAAQPLVFACVLHTLCLQLARPDQAFALTALAMLLGVGLGLRYGQPVLQGQRLPALVAHAVALASFATVAVALGPTLDRTAHASSALVAPLGFVAAAALGFALAVPACAPLRLARTELARQRELALLLLAAACAVPSAPALVLFAGYGAVSTVAAALLALPTLLALRAQP